MTADLRCVFFGDSITAGQYVDPEFHWTTLLRGRLAQGELAGVAFSVGAISGETSRQALERFPVQVQEWRPQVVTIQFGLNDCNRWRTDGGLARVSQLAFRANLLEMFERARRFGATQMILSTNHPTLRTTVFDDGTTYEESRRRYNEIVREVARGAGVRLHDVEAGFARFQASRLAELLLEPPDVLHLSPAGHVVYADLLEPVLRSALDAARDVAEDGVPPAPMVSVVERGSTTR
jgi:acyl-CoA thioesterase-1